MEGESLSEEAHVSHKHITLIPTNWETKPQGRKAIKKGEEGRNPRENNRKHTDATGSLFFFSFFFHKAEEDDFDEEEEEEAGEEGTRRPLSA